MLWGVKVPSKLKIFAWRLAGTSLPTGDVREHRNMADSEECTICQGATDTWRHALLECNMAKCIWALMDEDLIDFLAANKHDDPKLWLFELVESVSQREMIQILVTLWAIWWARRRSIHEQNFQSPLSTFSFIQRFLQDLKMVEAAPRGPAIPARVQERKWIAPVSGCVKINVDGGLSRSGERGAVSAVCTDDTGKFMGASAVVVEGLVDPETLEAVACSEALSLDFDLNISSVQVAADCLQVVKNIREQNPCKYSAIIHEFNAKRNQFQRIELGHEMRACNTETHVLVKASTSLESGRHLWLTSPPPIICFPVDIMQ